MGLEELAWGSIGVRIEGAVGGASLAIGDLIAQMRGFVGVDLTPLRRARHARSQRAAARPCDDAQRASSRDSQRGVRS